MAVAAMVVAVAGVALAGPVAHLSGGPVSKKKARSIARQEIGKNALSKTAVRNVTIAANGSVLAGDGISQANVSHPTTGQYCIDGLTPKIKNAVVTLDYSETGFKAQDFITVGGGGSCSGKQLWIAALNDSNGYANARLHVAVFSD